MELGLYTFADVSPEPGPGAIGPHERLRNLIEEIELADQVGLDVFGLGEHHRPDYAASAPVVALAAAAERTRRIKLTSAVTVLSSDDPVRVFQQFATLDLLSGGRAEIMAGRGSFIESFPLFGFNLEDYDELFAEKLDLLLAIRDQVKVTWQGRLRAPINGRGVYPRPLQEKLPVWIAIGGTPQSAARAGALGLPLALAIIGGEPA
ncbi:LLM class flavin-dependent oxidoreductase, partial [Mesorhizobium sp. M4B.F.Ca.ET.019.03.1.1]